MTKKINEAIKKRIFELHNCEWQKYSSSLIAKILVDEFEELETYNGNSVLRIIKNYKEHPYYSKIKGKPSKHIKSNAISVKVSEYMQELKNKEPELSNSEIAKMVHKKTGSNITAYAVQKHLNRKQKTTMI